jgi:carbamoyl-phosphate synthase large subunit
LPKRTDINTILIIGSGPIVIGQACEFDYSGTQACKALKEEGYRLILANSNPATIMTDPSIADKTYIEPLTVEYLERIIQKETPDAVLPTLGGQTGLNLALELAQKGIFKKYNVEMIGANEQVINKAEDRRLFKEAMDACGLKSARSSVTTCLEDAIKEADFLGYPCVVRPSFTLGGSGGGIAHTKEELIDIASGGLDKSLISEILIEESILGWKEFELEVMRDKNDNVVIICSIENLDPLGVHTGDSITVAPAQTLTDSQFQKMRDAAVKIMREIGVETGGSNVQFAVNPKNGDLVIIEMNPRVSRSSALASKATGFPIAKCAAKLAVGYTLDELYNDITKNTPASFEPTLDYCVVKIPRFNFKKFPDSHPFLGTAMKAVGEAMSIGRTFKEALQKSIRSLELNRSGIGFDAKDLSNVSEDELKKFIKNGNPWRLYYIKYAFQIGWGISDIYELSKIDPWFLFQIKQLVDYAKILTLDENSIRKAKKWGFSDSQIAKILSTDEESIRNFRIKKDIIPTYGLVDTCAAEFEAVTPYYYSTYETFSEIRPSTKKKVMILGGGPNRIGQGIEFDYCCVHASLTLKEEGYESIMVNSNPETVSTDFDSSDRLYFEPLTFEDVLNIYEAENPEGVIIQFGGQTPLNLAKKLESAGVKILGTSPKSIDDAEDRERFQEILQSLGLRQPDNGIAFSSDDAVAIAEKVGYPVVVRPSYVLGGASMKIVYDELTLRKYVLSAREISKDQPILIDKYLEHAKEVDVDALSDGKDCVIAGIMQHIEEAGVHSGDSACSLPPYSLSQGILNEIREATKKLATALNVVGLLNIQFAVKDEVLFLIEVNPRGSRTVPFVSKATGISWAKLATHIILGSTIQSLGIKEVIPPYFSVKEAVLPFNRFPNADTLLSPEMKSTGESMGIDLDFRIAFYKAQLSAGQKLPDSGTVFVSLDDDDKLLVFPLIQRLQKVGFNIVATEGTADYLLSQNISVNKVNKISKGGNTILPLLKRNEIKLAFITPSKKTVITDEFEIRQQLLIQKVPYVSTVPAMVESVRAIETLKDLDISVTALQDYYTTTG